MLAGSAFTVGGTLLSALGTYSEWDDWVWYYLAPAMVLAGAVFLACSLWPITSPAPATLVSATPSRPPSAAFYGDGNDIKMTGFDTTAQRVVDGSRNKVRARRSSHRPSGQ